MYIHETDFNTYNIFMLLNNNELQLKTTHHITNKQFYVNINDSKYDLQYLFDIIQNGLSLENIHSQDIFIALNEYENELHFVITVDNKLNLDSYKFVLTKI